MRKVLVPALLIAAALAVPAARADSTTYTINFLTEYTGAATPKQSGNSAPLPTSGIFTYDSTTQLFSNFIVQWDGATFDMTSVANNPHILQGTLPPNVTAGTGGEETFSLLTSDPDALWAVNGVPTNSFLTFFDDDETFNAQGGVITTYGLLAGLVPADPAFAFPGPIPASSQIASGTFSVVPTPEPSSFLLLGIGLLGFVSIVAFGRRRDHSEAA